MPSPIMLILMILPVAVAVVVAGLRSGGWRALLQLRLRHRWLVGGAAAVQFLRLSDPEWASVLLTPLRGALPVLAIWALVVAFVLANLPGLHRSGRAALSVFLAGMTMNFAAILANGGMPYSVPAARRAGLSPAQIDVEVLGHPHLTAESRLAPLADVLPVPPLHAVASVGDLLIFGGLSWLLISLTKRRTPVPAPPEPALLGGN